MSMYISSSSTFPLLELSDQSSSRYTYMSSISNKTSSALNLALASNPYAFMQYPYTMPVAPFYGYFQTPMRATVPNPPHISSQNRQASSLSAGQN